jgi:2-keto-4-pentenoate hydratase/2-oxohepta-3-ene-1,7-dioic acid hydratase in catechol pathway
VCCANDVSAYEWVGADSDWFRGKGSDTFSPFGPWITPGLDYRDLQLITRVNGEVVEDTRTTKMFYGVDELVSYVSRYMTIEPGDVFFTGTSGESTPLNDGDVVEVEVEGNGVLSNTFVLAT